MDFHSSSQVIDHSYVSSAFIGFRELTNPPVGYKWYQSHPSSDVMAASPYLYYSVEYRPPEPPPLSSHGNSPDVTFKPYYSPYTLICHTTLSSGQPFYALEIVNPITTPCSTITSLSSVTPECNVELQISGVDVVISDVSRLVETVVGDEDNLQVDVLKSGRAVGTVGGNGQADDSKLVKEAVEVQGELIVDAIEVEPQVFDKSPVRNSDLVVETVCEDDWSNDDDSFIRMNLTIFQHSSPIMEYVTEYMRIKSRAEFKFKCDFEDPLLAYCFVEGLDEDIREALELWAPQTLQEAIYLATFQELLIDESLLVESIVRKSDERLVEDRLFVDNYGVEIDSDMLAIDNVGNKESRDESGKDGGDAEEEGVLVPVDGAEQSFTAHTIANSLDKWYASTSKKNMLSFDPGGGTIASSMFTRGGYILELLLKDYVMSSITADSDAGNVHVLRLESPVLKGFAPNTVAYFANSEFVVVNSVREGTRLVPFNFTVSRQGTPELDKATDDSFIEQTAGALVWHLQATDTNFGSAQAKERHRHIENVLANEPVECFFILSNATIPGFMLYDGKELSHIKNIISCCKMNLIAPTHKMSSLLTYDIKPGVCFIASSPHTSKSSVFRGHRDHWSWITGRLIRLDVINGDAWYMIAIILVFDPGDCSCYQGLLHNRMEIGVTTEQLRRHNQAAAEQRRQRNVGSTTIVTVWPLLWMAAEIGGSQHNNTTPELSGQQNLNSSAAGSVTEWQRLWWAEEIEFNQSGYHLEAVLVLRDVHSQGSKLDDTSVSSGLVAEALSVLNEFTGQGTELELVTWTSMVASWSHHGKVIEAPEFFREMQVVGVKPNAITIPYLLPACGNFAVATMPELFAGDVQSKKGSTRQSILFAVQELDNPVVKPFVKKMACVWYWSVITLIFDPGGYGCYKVFNCYILDHIFLYLIQESRFKLCLESGSSLRTRMFLRGMDCNGPGMGLFIISLGPLD